ncbi:MAG TPA: GNAT family N-acetyltransferase, partial [Armatimonadota bacterium]|nr:GNAT family N-acetyltransferase [Armatimonadota bacterium]
FYVARWAEEIRIVDIALLPEHRGGGVGTMLIRRLFDEGDASGRKVSIHVEIFNPARRLYERLGFVQAAERGVYLLMERNPIAAVVDG